MLNREFHRRPSQDARRHERDGQSREFLDRRVALLGGELAPKDELPTGMAEFGDDAVRSYELRMSLLKLFEEPRGHVAERALGRTTSGPLSNRERSALSAVRSLAVLAGS